MASFYGTETYAIDHKGRINIPLSMRRASERRKPLSGFFLTRGFDGCIAAYPEEEWGLVEERLRRMPMGDAKGRQFERAFRKLVFKVAVDTQGRITIPPSLLDRAGLGKEAVLHGMGNRIEIWNPERFQNSTAEAEADGQFEKLAAEVLGGKP